MSALKKSLKPLLGVLISGLLLWQVLRQMDGQRVAELWAQAQAAPLLLAVAVVLLGFALRAWRWHIMLRFFSQRVRYRTSATVFMASFALNNTLPLRAGDVARTFLYSKELDVPPASLAATLLIERILDAATLVFFLVLGLQLLPAGQLPAAWQGAMTQAGRWLLPLVLLGLACLVALPKLLPPVMLAWQARVKPGRSADKLRLVVAQFAHAFGLLRSPLVVAQLLFLSLLSWAVEGCVFALGAYALGLSFGVYAPWFALALATLATLIPGTPGHLGTFDYFAVQAFALFGMSQSDGGSLALVVHLLLWLPVTVVGGVLLLRSKGTGALSQIQELEKKEHA